MQTTDLVETINLEWEWDYEISNIAILEDKKILTYSLEHIYQDKIYKLYDETGCFLKTFEGAKDDEFNIEILECGKVLSLIERKEIGRFIIENQKIIYSESNKNGIFIKYIDEKRWITFGVRRFVDFYTFSISGNQLFFKGHSNTINGVRFLKNKKFLSYSNDKTIKLWGKKGRVLKDYLGHKGNVNGIVLVDEKHFISYSSDYTLILWHLDGRLLKVFRDGKSYISFATLTSDGKLLSYTMSGIKIWDIDENSNKQEANSNKSLGDHNGAK